MDIMTRDEAAQIINMIWHTNPALFHRLRDAACERAIERMPDMEEIGTSDMWHFMISDLIYGEFETPHWDMNTWQVVPGPLGANVLA